MELSLLDFAHNTLLGDTEKGKPDDSLFQKKYTLKDTGIPPRVLTHWRKEQLFLQDTRPGEHYLLDRTDLAWFKQLKVLRQFGLSLPALKQLKAMICPSVSIADLMHTPHGKEIAKGAFGPENEVFIQAAIQRKNDVRTGFQLNYLCYYLHAYTAEKELELRIRHDGTYLPYSRLKDITLMRNSGYASWMDEPYILIPISALNEAV